MKNFLIIVVVLSLVPFVTACSRGPNYQCVNLSGAITIDGKPVPKGYVTFTPEDQNAGPVVGGQITNGKYRCANVPLGKHRVSFVCHGSETTTIVDRATGAKHQLPMDILPPRCRAGVDVEVKQGQTTLDFALQSKL